MRELEVPGPYAAEWVRQEMVGKVPDLYTGGYEIFTTIDANQQSEAEQALRRGLIKYDRDHGYRGAEGQVPEDLLAKIRQFYSMSKPPVAAEFADDSSTSNESAAMEADADKDDGYADPRAALAQALQQRLDERDSYPEQIPAVVLRVEDKRALVFASDLGIGEVQLKDSRWARHYLLWTSGNRRSVR